jgi:hypothetical protein
MPKQLPAADNNSPAPPPPSPTVRPFSHIPLVRRISLRQALDSLKKLVDREQIHSALLEFQAQVVTDFSLDEDERMQSFLLMMIHQIRGEPIDNIDTQERSSLLQLITRTMKFLDLSDKWMTPIGVGNAVRFMKLQISDPDY